MQVTIQGKQIDLGAALRTHAEDKLHDINSKFFDRATFATVTLSREGHGHGLVKAHIMLQVGKNLKVMADAQEGDAYIAFDRALERITQQLRRQKERLRDHHHQSDRKVVTMDYAATDYDAERRAESREGPAVVAEMASEPESMSVSEAVRRLEEADLPALMFRNASHDGLNMVYKRTDGNVGWVDPIGNHVIAHHQMADGKADGKSQARRA